MKRPSLAAVLFAAFAVVPLTVPRAIAYERYNDGCQTCHGRFTDATSPKGSVFPNNNKHEMHRNSSYMDTECDLCHTSGDQGNAYIGSSNGTAINPGIGCNGCHQEHGVGARHADAGVSECVSCHTDDPPPPAENVKPVYYGTADTRANNSCNPAATSNTNENWTVGDFEGIDNDGDGLCDGADPDCGGPTTTSGETLGLAVTAHDKLSRVIKISYDNSTCSATDNNLYYGPLGDVSSYGYSGAVCDIGNTGTYDWAYASAPSSAFFLVVANDESVEGSYGVGSTAGERSAAGMCPETYDLSQRCD